MGWDFETELGISNEMPFAKMLVNAQVMAIVDGPTEVHKLTLARQLLKEYGPVGGLWPTGHLPSRKAAARVPLRRAARKPDRQRRVTRKSRENHGLAGSPLG